MVLTFKCPNPLHISRLILGKYFPINSEASLSFLSRVISLILLLQAPPVSSTSVTPETSSPNQRTKSFTPRFSLSNIRTPRPQQKVRSQPPSQPVILPPTPPQSRSSFEHSADTDNKITRTYDSSPRQEPNQQRGKRIKKPVAQVSFYYFFWCEIEPLKDYCLILFD